MDYDMLGWRVTEIFWYGPDSLAAFVQNNPCKPVSDGNALSSFPVNTIDQTLERLLTSPIHS